MGSPWLPKETGVPEMPGPPTGVHGVGGAISIAERPTIGVPERWGELDRRQMCLN